MATLLRAAYKRELERLPASETVVYLERMTVVLLRVGALFVIAFVLADAALVRDRLRALDEADDSRHALNGMQEAV